MLFCKLELVPVAASDTKLIYLSVAYDIPTSVEHTGMGFFHTKIIVPQIGMSVKVNDMQIRIFLCHSSNRTESDKVFSAYHARHFAVVKYFCCTVLDISQCALRIAKWQFKVATVEHIHVEKVLILIW